MIVTNKDIAKDIAENMMVQEDVISVSVVKDMMYYMRDIYETKIKNLDTEIETITSQSKSIEEILDEDELVESNLENIEIENFFENMLEKVASELLKENTQTKEGK